MVPIFETGLGKLYEGDCLDFFKEVDDNSIDLAFADPPFNLGKLYKSRMDDSIPEQEYLEWSHAWVDELIRVVKPGGALFLWNLPKWNLPLGAYLSQKMTFRHWIAVDIKYTLPIAKRLYPSHYSLLYFIKGKKPNIFHPDRLPIPCCRHCGGEQKDYGGYKDKMNPKGVSLADVWTDIPPVRHKRYKSRDANELSLKLMDRILTIASDEGSIVLDPFGGAGTTFIAAELLGRRWIGSELHCADIRNRFGRLESEREYIEKIHSEKNVLFKASDLSTRKRFGKPLSPNYRTPDRFIEKGPQQPLLIT